MLKKTIILIATSIIVLLQSYAQNYSGLENKKLIKSDDLSSLLESGIGMIFGNKIKGEIDSVIVKQDSERQLKLKIYYKEYIEGYFSVGVLDASRADQTQFKDFQSAVIANGNPFECTIEMKSNVQDNTSIESAYLRIDVGKRKGRKGNVSVFVLNKKWQSTINNENIVIDINPIAVGSAASLTNIKKDVKPTKPIIFDPGKSYIKPTDFKKINNYKILKTGGGNTFQKQFDFNSILNDLDINGTWVNTDESTTSTTKIIITNSNTIQVFNKCSPSDCDWGTKTLQKVSSNTYRAIFNISFFNRSITIFEQSDGMLKVTLNTSSTGGLAKKTTSKTMTFKKNLVFLPVYLKTYSLAQFAALPPSGNSADKTPKGPDKNKPIYLLGGLTVDPQVDFRRPQDITNININVYGDKNGYSGVYYIMPADYHLLWEPKAEAEKGYEFRILYGSISEDASVEAPVRMSAVLTAGISNRERAFALEMLKTIPGFKEMRFLPLRESPQFTFQNTLGAQYNIPEEKVSVEQITDLSGDIRVAWQTDASTKDFIQAAITSREGISASVILKPDNEDILDQQIPAIINIADSRTLGKMHLQPTQWRTQNWRNESPYPLRLKYIHVLKKEIGSSTPIIYSWSLDEKVVPSKAQVKFNNTKIPAWLDTDPSVVMWVDYSVEECNDCDLKIMDAITGGISGTRSQQIKFSIPPVVFDSLSASYFLISVRTVQGDPKGLTMKEFASVKLTPEANESFVGPVYLPASATLQYEYKITLASKDGDFYPSNSWLTGTELENYIGKTTLKNLFQGIIPGID